MKRFNRILMSALLCGAAVCAAAPASADNFSYSIYLSPTEPLAAYGYIPWAKAITERTGGKVKIETYLGGSLLPARDNLTGTRDGVADIAMHPITYTPSELPIWNIIPDVAFKFPDPFVTAFASTEYGLLDKEGNGEFASAGVVYLGGYSTPAYHFICRDAKIASVADLKGKRVRTPGGPWSRFVKSIGMVDVNIPSSEMYTAFERGAVDCGAADPTHLISGANLLRVAKGYSVMNMGPYFAGASWIVNPASWSRISPENRKIIFEESAKGLVAAMVGYVTKGDEGVSQARAAGIAMVEPAADLTAAYDKFVAGIDADMVAAGTKAGVKNMDQEVADITALMAKWTKLLDGVDRNDQAKMSKLVWDEIYSKLDPNTYGVKK
ncbi:TRAP-type C4-dicarboxylate transport system substrate-binding protein [Microvirga flocculans]|uniref:TRAP-type C4-dicarboxylate transport system substrate-binding protein n=1 Tax=Microvirga flocculans TaxID=217168 RepID=A0A7W6IC42_9HYPH|nr:C4-dicarboxylate TRAP transporter substrate-binding protein [Microvirga flocculans]MBB4038723.1 TRAP-type C4-dicarboxylate transport system substrate-binding protein [Microvirga flocculans]